MTKGGRKVVKKRKKKGGKEGVLRWKKININV